MAGGLLLGAKAAMWTMTSLGLSWGTEFSIFSPAVCGCIVAGRELQACTRKLRRACTRNIAIRFSSIVPICLIASCAKLAAHVARVAYDLGDLRAASLRQMWCEIWSEFDVIKTAHEPEHGPYLTPHLP